MDDENIPDGFTKKQKLEKSFIMNRLILIGNGFDLAHGMKTRYFDFIFRYLQECFAVTRTARYYNDELITINSKEFDYNGIEDFTFNDLMGFRKNEDEKITIINQVANFGGSYNTSDYPYYLKVKSPFLEHLLDHCCEYNWVDIENAYYDHLKKLIGTKGEIEKDLKKLNDDFTFIIERLKDYLRLQAPKDIISDIPRLFMEKIRKDDLVTIKVDDDEAPENITIINFNYTDTVREYFQSPKSGLYRKPLTIIHIHGDLSNHENPIIFGFGDELDESYKLLEAEKRKGFLDYMKSFWYFKTSNYHDLIRFIESGDYQVYTMGHSCGLSDRTMLNMIFEHQNCKSIKIFPFVHNGQDNYTELTQEISRHFKDKGVMRKKIVNRRASTQMPQSPFPKT